MGSSKSTWRNLAGVRTEDDNWVTEAAHLPVFKRKSWGSSWSMPLWPSAEGQTSPAEPCRLLGATWALVNICTAGLNLVELNLSLLNSPLLQQGQDEATWFQLYWSNYSFPFCCSPSLRYILRQPRHELGNRARLGSAKAGTELFSPNPSAWPKSAGPHKQPSQEYALDSESVPLG